MTKQVDCSWCTKTKLPAWYGNEDGSGIILCRECLDKSMDQERKAKENS